MQFPIFVQNHEGESIGIPLLISETIQQRMCVTDSFTIFRLNVQTPKETAPFAKWGLSSRWH